LVFSNLVRRPEESECERKEQSRTQAIAIAESIHNHRERVREGGRT